MSKQDFILSIILLSLILGINYVFSITFTAYFIICALALLLNVFLGNRIICWTIITVSSIVVTLNYLRPSADVYNNASHHVIALRGVEKHNTLSLINSSTPQKAICDGDKYYGALSAFVKDNELILKENLSSHPLYLFDSISNSYRLMNKSHLIKMSKTIRYRKDKHFVELSLQNREDSLECKAIFSTDTVRVVNLAFNKKIREGYPLIDILRSGGKCSSLEEEILSIIKDTYIIKDSQSKKKDGNWFKAIASKYSEESNKDGDSSVWYLTIPKKVTEEIKNKRVEILSDNQKYELNDSVENVYKISPKQNIYWGVGSEKYRALNFEKAEGNGVKLCFDMPIMYNFPTDTIGCCNKIAAISSSSEDLLDSNVKEAFFFDLFTKKKNNYHFNGTISYQTSKSPAPLNVNILDGYKEKDKKAIANTNYANHFQLSTLGGSAKWNVSVVNLRETNPITEKSNPYISEWLIIGIILFVSFVTIFSSQMFFGISLNVPKWLSVFNIWSFFTPMITLRLYLLWRIAVFPPTTNISKNEFCRYIMQNSLGENAMVWTLSCIGLLILLTIGLYFYESKFKSKMKPLTPKLGIIIYVGLIIIAIAMVLSGKVWGNIMVPVLVFFLNEYICLKTLKLPYRIVNTIIVLGLLLKGDPGYAIMFLIFVAIYYIIQTVVYCKSDSTYKVKRRAATILLICLSIFVIAIIIMAPELMAILFSNDSFMGLDVPFLIIGAILTLIAIISIRMVRIYYGKKTSIIIAVILVVLIPIGCYIIPNMLNDNKHIKYRSLIHTQDVGQIMINEDVETRDNKQLLEASQNQWFLQYHSNLGEDRVLEDGIIKLQSHFKKGVSWNTQISDVICSRYIIGELSVIVPLAIILFILAFFISSLKDKNNSPYGKCITYGIALLFLIQTIFVWMANTNRMIFFGQDIPFMSQNARVIMIMFCILLFMMMCTSGKKEFDDDNIDDRLSNEGFERFNRKPIVGLCVSFILVFGFVYLFGNNYSSLYQTDKAVEYNAGEAMMQAEKDLGKINTYMAQYKATEELKPNKRNLTKLFDKIDKSIRIDDYVKELDSLGVIQPFTTSLYRAFRKNLQTDNKFENIIHLKYISATKSYKFALNNGFYSLRAPEMQKMLWSGDVYAYNNDNNVENVRVPTSNDKKIKIYRIPKSWLKDKSKDIGIADVRYANDYDVTLRSSECDYKIDTANIFAIIPEDVVESKEKNGVGIYIDQLSGQKEKLLAKNMMVNGQNKFFYPMGESLYWIKDFSELLATQHYSDKNKDCELTLDKDLLEDVYAILENEETGKKTCSVTALDGKGNVRLMAEYNSREEYNLNPNNTEAIERFVEHSYLNPNYSEDSKIFGNQNLLYMKPGPASSLKPITYAAVTSYAPHIDWASLILRAPDSKYRKSGNYYMDSFGPNYKYLGSEAFKSIASDEEGVDGWVNSLFYLSKSSNYYNALITYFGNYEEGQLDNIYNIIEETTDDSSYPIFKLNEKTYRFKDSPSGARESCVLSKALRNNFKMKVASDEKDSTRFISSEWITTAKSKNHPWVFPETSNAYETQLANLSSDAHRLKQFTLGSFPLEITPMMMAEMYGRLFSLHPDFYACITKNDNKQIEDWMAPNMFGFYKKQLYKGMNMCVTSGTASGTLSGVNCKDGKYYLYAKTGTLLGENSTKEDRMLAVIITNMDLSKAESPNDYKFYVVYFRFVQTGDMYNVSKIINKIIDSKSFNDYMNS